MRSKAVRRIARLYSSISRSIVINDVLFALSKDRRHLLIYDMRGSPVWVWLPIGSAVIGGVNLLRVVPDSLFVSSFDESLDEVPLWGPETFSLVFGRFKKGGIMSSVGAPLVCDEDRNNADNIIVTYLSGFSDDDVYEAACFCSNLISKGGMPGFTPGKLAAWGAAVAFSLVLFLAGALSLDRPEYHHSAAAPSFAPSAGDVLVLPSAPKR